MTAARSVVAQTAAMLERAPAFQRLDQRAQTAILHDLGAIRGALHGTGQAAGSSYDPYDPTVLARGAVAPQPAPHDPYALSLDTPGSLARLRGGPDRSPMGDGAG